MSYEGSYKIFDRSEVKTYPLQERPNKVSVDDFINLDKCKRKNYEIESKKELVKTAEKIVSAREANKPVFWMMGAHPVKNGLSPIIINWLKRGIITTLSGTTATTIHDFELALIGETSEDVPEALPEGKFGLAYETGKYLNDALRWGAENNLGYGESIARMISGEEIAYEGMKDGSYSVDCSYPGKSILLTAYRQGVPVTIHSSIGTDIIDEHPNFRGGAKGKTSGFDFEIFVRQVSKMAEGGMFLNVGTAITGPEVLLKALAMVTGAGEELKNVHTADFDIRSVPSTFPAQDKESYYFRDFKSVVTRIPRSFGGQGVYVQGNHLQTLPALYKEVEEKLHE